MIKKYYLDKEMLEEDFSLIAILANCEGYKLAYCINFNSDCKFKKSKNNFYSIDHKESNFSTYEWIDDVKGIESYLISNRSIISKDKNESQNRLFDIPLTKELYLIKDLKEVDFIIKIKSGIRADILSKKIKDIREVSYCYIPELKGLKLYNLINN